MRSTVTNSTRDILEPLHTLPPASASARGSYGWSGSQSAIAASSAASAARGSGDLQPDILIAGACSAGPRQALALEPQHAHQCWSAGEWSWSPGHGVSERSPSRRPPLRPASRAEPMNVGTPCARIPGADAPGSRSAHRREDHRRSRRQPLPFRRSTWPPPRRGGIVTSTLGAVGERDRDLGATGDLAQPDFQPIADIAAPHPARSVHRRGHRTDPGSFPRGRQRSRTSRHPGSAPPRTLGEVAIGLLAHLRRATGIDLAAVVLPALLFVGEQLVGGRDFLEALLRLLVARMEIRMRGLGKACDRRRGSARVSRPG